MKIPKEKMRELLLEFAGRAVTYDAATAHFTYVGATGAGKTLCSRLLVESIWGIATMYCVPTRMVVYDSKRELLPILHGIFEHLGRTDAAEKITLLNPFDRRGVAWDMCKDIRRPVHADELAALLIPSAHGDGKFWTDAAQTIVGQVIQSFIHFRTEWDLRDLVLALEDDTAIRSVTDRLPRTQRVVESLLKEQRTGAGILATITAALKPFRSIAIQWQDAPKVSLRDWLKGGDGILVLGSAETAETAVQALNALIFKRLSQMILEEQPEVPADDPRRIWIILDEFVRAGRLPGAVDLATKGRSKGACLVLGFQDVDGLRAIYGREVANEILGQCSNIALLRMNSTETAEWASDVVGEYRAIDKRYGASAGASYGRDHALSSSQSADETVVDRRAVLPSYFQRITPVSKGKGIGGIFLSPYWADGGLEVSEYLITATRLFDEGDLWPVSKNVVGYDYADVPALEDMPDEYIGEHLREWTPEEISRLGLLVRPDQKAQETNHANDTKGNNGNNADTDNTRGQSKGKDYELDQTGTRRRPRFRLTRD